MNNQEQINKLLLEWATLSERIIAIQKEILYLNNPKLKWKN